MTTEELVDHLKQGYSVMRNVINGKMSGVPMAASVNGQLKSATICKICRTLDVEIPPDGISAEPILDHIHKNLNKITGKE